MAKTIPFIKYRGVTVYQCYRTKDQDSELLTEFWFCTRVKDRDSKAGGATQFDIRDFQQRLKITPAVIIEGRGVNLSPEHYLLMDAIDEGLVTRLGLAEEADSDDG